MNNPDSPATSRQTWALFCLTKKDHRNMNLTKQQASELIEKYKAEKPAKADKEKAFQDIWDKAHEAGLNAGKNAIPTPMIVQERENPLDDNSKLKKLYHVSEGACGFAWVNIKPATSSFARWMKKQGLARPDSYYGGITVWISEFGQSITRKEAYGSAFAKVLQNNGIKAYMSSRMD